MLRPRVVHEAIRMIRKNSTAEIYVYTANVADVSRACDVLAAADGICVTLHHAGDVSDWERFASAAYQAGLAAHRSCRLNVFSGIELPSDMPPSWQVKSGIEWIEKCPLPEDEVFMRWVQVQHSEPRSKADWKTTGT